MYLQNKYTHWYNNIVDRARSRIVGGYVEKHHITPRCLGGNDTADNLINLTPKEHFLCHWLLTKMVPKSPEQKKLFHAFSAMRMKSSNQKRITGKMYEILSRASSIAMQGNTHNKGKKRSVESNEKQRKSMIEKYQTQQYIHTGKTYEEIYGVEEAIKRKEKLKGPRGPRKNPPGPQKLITCPHCNKTGGISNMKRYHFERCLFQ